MNHIEENLNTNGIAMAKTDGNSMEPMLQNGDTVVIVPPVFPLKKYDVPVYHRGDHLTMHRIIRVTKKGYVICGDNRSCPEFDITEREIIGVLAAYWKNGNLIDCKTDPAYLRYSKRITANYAKRRARYLRSALKRKVLRGIKR